MPTKRELFNQLKIDLNKGEGEDPVHLVDHKKERERKRTNPDQSTKVYLNCYSPESWKEFQVEKDRYFTVAVDPHIAIDLIVRAMKAQTNATLHEWVKEGHQEEGDIPGPPKAEFPAWMKE